MCSRSAEAVGGICLVAGPRCPRARSRPRPASGARGSHARSVPATETRTDRSGRTNGQVRRLAGVCRGPRPGDLVQRAGGRTGPTPGRRPRSRVVPPARCVHRVRPPTWGGRGSRSGDVRRGALGRAGGPGARRTQLGTPSVRRRPTRRPGPGDRRREAQPPLRCLLTSGSLLTSSGEGPGTAGPSVTPVGSGRTSRPSKVVRHPGWGANDTQVWGADDVAPTPVVCFANPSG